MRCPILALSLVWDIDVQMEILLFLLFLCCGKSSLFRRNGNEEIGLTQNAYLGTFDAEDSVLFEGLTGVHCIYSCLKYSTHIRMAVYSRDEQKCVCLENLILDGFGNDKKVFAVNLNRPGKYFKG